MVFKLVYNWHRASLSYRKTPIFNLLVSNQTLYSGKSCIFIPYENHPPRTIPTSSGRRYSCDEIVRGADGKAYRKNGRRLHMNQTAFGALCEWIWSVCCISSVAHSSRRFSRISSMMVGFVRIESSRSAEADLAAYISNQEYGEAAGWCSDVLHLTRRCAESKDYLTDIEIMTRRISVQLLNRQRCKASTVYMSGGSPEICVDGTEV